MSLTDGKLWWIMGTEQTTQALTAAATKFETGMHFREHYAESCRFGAEVYAVNPCNDGNLYVCTRTAAGTTFTDGPTLQELSLHARLLAEGDAQLDGFYFPITSGLFSIDPLAAEAAWQWLQGFMNKKKVSVPSVSLHGVRATFGQMYEKQEGLCTKILPPEFDIYHTSTDLGGRVTHHLHSGRLHQPLLNH